MFGTFTLCAVAGFCLFLSPGIILDWLVGRFADAPDGLLASAIKDGVTWLVSLLIWVSVGALVVMLYKRHAKLHSAPMDAFPAPSGGTADGYSQWQQPPPQPEAEYAHAQGVPPPAGDDGLASLCTDEACAEALGLSGDLTMEDIRSAYRQRIAAYHPDKVAHLGPKLQAVAETESKQLNMAYQYFEERYGQVA